VSGRDGRCGFSLSLKYNGHLGTRKILPYLPLALDSTPHSTHLCLTCASPFAECPVYALPVASQFDEQQRALRIVTDVDHCWCMACETSAQTLLEASSGHTEHSAQRVTHDALELERYLFESYTATARASSTPLRVPVLYLRHIFLNKSVFDDIEHTWGVRRLDCAASLEPRWLRSLRSLLDDELRTDGLLDAVLAPFTATLVYVARHPSVVRDLLDDRRHSLRSRFAIDVPARVVAHLDTHRIYTATLVRVVVAYRLLSACNGNAWSFDGCLTDVPYTTNSTLQHTCLQLQLFADTHLDLFAAVQAFGASADADECRYDDCLLSADLVSSSADAGNSFLHTAATPLGARLSLMERSYPHPVRAPWAGEISSLGGTPLYVGNMWNVHTRQGGPTMVNRAATTAAKRGGNARDAGELGDTRSTSSAAAAASANRQTDDEFLDASVHLLLSKTLNHPSLRRNYANMATRDMRRFPALFAIQLASFECSALGSYPGARYRPRWRARVAVRRAHHHSSLSFEPAWCASCGTDRLKRATKMTVRANECPRCEHHAQSLWCANECMRSSYVSAHDAELAVAIDGGFGVDAEMETRDDTSNTHSSVSRALRIRSAEEERVARLEVNAAFERDRAAVDVADSCDLCAAEQQRRAAAGRDELSARELLELHYGQKHTCRACRSHEHDDSQAVHEARARGIRSKIGSKALCSRHLCSACELIGHNELYSFYVAKEAYAFRVDVEGCAEHVLNEHNSWRAYRRLLYDGMDQVRRLFDEAYCGNAARPPLLSVPPAAIDRDLSSQIREMVHTVHKFVKKTSVKFKKESFVDVFTKNLRAQYAKMCVQQNMTRPQRPEDMLDEPQLVLDAARVEEARLRDVLKADEARLEARVSELRADTERAHGDLVRWRHEYKLSSCDVRRLAERAAAQAMEMMADARGTGVSSTAAVNFRLLRYAGLSESSLQLVQEAAFNYEVLCMPDNPLASYAERLERTNRADFCALLVFCATFQTRSSLRIYPLSTEAARAQMAALRARLGLLPYEEAPIDIDVVHVCIDCYRWYAPLVSPTCYSELGRIINDHRGRAVRMDRAAREPGSVSNSGGAQSTSSNMLLDLRLGKLVCPLNANSTSLKRMRKFGELERDLVFMHDTAKARSIRTMRERGSACGTRPLVKMAMLGVAVRLTNDGQHGNVYALCGVCGQLFCMAEGKPMNDGVPQCTRHTLIGGTATLPYQALHAFRPTLTYMSRASAGAASSLKLAKMTPVGDTSAASYTSPVQTRLDLTRQMYMLDSYEYGVPTRLHLFGGTLTPSQVAARGWLRSTPSIAHPKGVVERFATAVVRRAFPLFDPDSMLCSASSAPSSVPTLNSAELRRELANDWMTFDLAKSRLRREEDALRREFDAAIDMLGEHNLLGATRLVEQMQLESEDSANLTRRKARAETLNGAMSPLLVACRERCMQLLSAVYGVEHGCTVVACAYCGSVAEQRSRYVRLDVLDLDGLCRNRFTAAPVMASALADYSDTSARVELFLCDRHFGQAQPLLAHFPLPTSAMLFVFLLYSTRDSLEQPKKFRDSMYSAMADEYEDFFGTAEEAEQRKSRSSKRTPGVRKRAKRSRISTLPDRARTLPALAGAPKRRGRRPSPATVLAKRSAARVGSSLATAVFNASSDVAGDHE